MAEKQNTFAGAVLAFPNDSLHFLCGEVMTFRQQLTVRSANELQTLDGWSDAIDKYMRQELDKLALTVARIAYNPAAGTQEEFEEEARDASRSLGEDYSAHSIRADDVLMPAKPPRPLAYQLDGTDPNIPQLDSANCPNNQLRGFVTGIDDLFVTATRLDSRHQTEWITAQEAAMLRRKLEKLWALCEEKGGAVNRTDIPSGVLPSQEPTTLGGTA